MSNRAARITRLSKLLPQPEGEWKCVRIDLQDGESEAEAKARHLAVHPGDADASLFIYVSFFGPEVRRAA